MGQGIGLAEEEEEELQGQVAVLDSTILGGTTTEEGGGILLMLLMLRLMLEREKISLPQGVLEEAVELEPEPLLLPEEEPEEVAVEVAVEVADVPVVCLLVFDKLVVDFLIFTWFFCKNIGWSELRFFSSEGLTVGY